MNFSLDLGDVLSEGSDIWKLKLKKLKALLLSSNLLLRSWFNSSLKYPWISWWTVHWFVPSLFSVVDQSWKHVLLWIWCGEKLGEIKTALQGGSKKQPTCWAFASRTWAWNWEPGQKWWPLLVRVKINKKVLGDITELWSRVCRSFVTLFKVIWGIDCGWKTRGYSGVNFAMDWNWESNSSSASVNLIEV